jgi:hypothetical protein
LEGFCFSCGEGFEDCFVGVMEVRLRSEGHAKSGRVGSLIDGRREDCLVRRGLKRCLVLVRGLCFWQGQGLGDSGLSPQRPRSMTETGIG